MDLHVQSTRDTFAHELTHVYQDQRLVGPDTITASGEDLNNWFGSGSDPYILRLSDSTTWNSLGAEQQAQLVENYQHYMDKGYFDDKKGPVVSAANIAHYKRMLGGEKLFGLK